VTRKIIKKIAGQEKKKVMQTDVKLANCHQKNTAIKHGGVTAA